MYCEKFNTKMSMAFCELCQATAVWGSSELRKGYPECICVTESVLSRIWKCGQCERLTKNRAEHIITLEEWKKIAKPIMEMALERIFRSTQEYDHERQKVYWREYKKSHKGGGEKEDE